MCVTRSLMRVHELVVDRGGHEAARARLADLAGVEERAEQRAVHGDGEVRVVADDRGALAAQLEGDLLDRVRGQLHDAPARFRGAGERDLVHHGVGAQLLAHHGPDPITTLSTPGGRPHSAAALRDLQRGERRVGGGLEDKRVAHDERRCDLPDRHHEGEVPGDDARADADGLPVDEVPGDGRHVDPRQRLVGRHPLAQLDERLEVLDADGDVHHRGLADRGARVGGLYPRKLVLPLLQLLHHPHEDLGPLLHVHAAPDPGVEGFPRGLDGPLGISPWWPPAPGRSALRWRG